MYVFLRDIKNFIPRRETGSRPGLRTAVLGCLATLFLLVASIPATAMRAPFGVQTGSFRNLDRAFEQFAQLSTALDEPFREDLRIERIGGYFAVRFGSFRRYRDALASAASVTTVSPDAFVFNEPTFPAEHLLLLYPKISGSEIPFALEVGRFDTTGEAEARLQFVQASLEAEIPGNSRLEEEAAAFVVLVGRFENLDEARRLRRTLKPIVPEIRIRSGLSELKKPSPPSDGLSTADVPPSDATTLSKEPAPKKEMSPSLTQQVVRPIAEIENEMERLLDEQQYGIAVEVIKKAIETWPDNPELYSWYGTALLEMDRPDKALEHYRKAAELAPAVPDYPSNMGYSLYEMHLGSARRAIDSFQSALRLDPKNADALEGLGNVYVSIGQTDLAEDVKNELENIDPAAARRLEGMIENGPDWER